jgi:small subunit ribosomal protein S2
MSVVSLAELLESGVHFGHQTRRWSPKMKKYIYAARNGVHIIDLVQTAQLMEDAYSYLRGAAADGKKVLFIGTKRQAAGIIAQEAKRCKGYYVNQRWLGGMLTNWETIRTRIDRLKELEQLNDSGALDKRPKKEASSLRRELEKLEKYLGGLKTMRRIPDIVVVVDIRREHNAIQECQKLGIPVVAMIDTNCDPNLVDIPIPANDDAIRSIKLIIGKLADAINEGHHGVPMDKSEYDYVEEEDIYDEDSEEDSSISDEYDEELDDYAPEDSEE